MVLAPSFDELAIHGIPMPLRPALNIVDDSIVGESGGTLDGDKIVKGASPEMPPPSVESSFDINLLDRVFSKKICMVKCIPPRARLGFTKTFRGH